jgi:hypothetical protein
VHADLLQEGVTVSLAGQVSTDRFIRVDPGPALGLVAVMLGNLYAGLVDGLLLAPLLLFLERLGLRA